MSYRENVRTRAGAALGAVALEAGLVAVLLFGLAGTVQRTIADAPLTAFTLAPEVSAPKPVVPAPQRNRRPAGAAAPPNLRSEATQVTAPEPVVPPLVPPPMVVAAQPGAANDPTSGSAEVPGPGTGAGGIGDGRGSGGSGDGDGGGWGDETPPRLLRGSLGDADYPEAAKVAMIGGAVGVRYLVATDGRVRECEVTRSSGSRLLDSTTCQLIERRFRYAPSRDARGRPVPSYIVETHSFEMRD